LTSIGNSLAEAQAIYNKVEDVLDRETQLVDPRSSLPIFWKCR
jgi:hypothetical protein